MKFFAATALLVACAVSLWVDVLDSGLSGAGALLTSERTALDGHIYGAKNAPARMLFEAASYVGLLILLAAGILAAMGRMSRFVAAAGAIGVVVGVHRIVMLLIDQRPSWLFDLSITVVAVVGCAVACVLVSREAKRQATG